MNLINTFKSIRIPNIEKINPTCKNVSAIYFKILYTAYPVIPMIKKSIIFVV